MPSPLPYNRQNALASTVANDNTDIIKGKIVLTTGVTQGGIGANFVEEIAKHKPGLLILAGRNRSKVQATADKIAANPASANVPVRILILDLASQQQIREAAKEVLAYAEDHVDVVVNSAGLMIGPFRTTEEGIELQFGSNHIWHFLFTNLIMSKVLKSKTPRIVNVSSDGHRFGAIRFEDPSFQDGEVYDAWEAYGQSKTAVLLFSKSLAEKLGARGLRAYSLHPGVALGTSLSPGFEEKDLESLKAKDEEMGFSGELDFKNMDEVTATHVVAAFDPRLDKYNGSYLADGNVADDKLQPTATKQGDAEKLWLMSEKLVGETFAY
jgi:NAD(P)-dependent dehydrogenase (short-subunit alcohol dehydrogenase family)